jgi:hypothetical protein
MNSPIPNPKIPESLPRISFAFCRRAKGKEKRRRSFDSAFPGLARDGGKEKGKGREIP